MNAFERHDADAAVWVEAELFQPFSLQPDFGERLTTPHVTGEFDFECS